jgi:hypothetical protein
MKIRVKITRKPKEESSESGGCEDRDLLSPLKDRKKLTLDDRKLAKLHDSISSEITERTTTMHSSFNSSINSTQLLNDSFSHVDLHGETAFLSSKRNSICSAKEKIKIDLDRLFSKKQLHDSEPSARRLPVSKLSAIKPDKKLDNKGVQQPLVERTYSNRRSRSKTPAIRKSRRSQTPDARGVGRTLSLIEAAAPPPERRREPPRRSKSLNFRTSDEVIQAYEALQAQEIEQAEREENKRRTLRQSQRKQHVQLNTDCAESNPLSSDIPRDIEWQPAACNDSLDQPRKPPPRRKSANLVTTRDIVRAYDDIVHEFDTVDVSK